jgi:hypothetical protein
VNTRSARNWLSLSGLFAAVFYVLHVVLGTQNYPGYDWLKQAVSDLTAVDAPSYIIASRFTALYGALSCICCVILSLMLTNEKSKLFKYGIYIYTLMNWVSFIGYTLFPLSSSGFKGTIQDIMHFYVVTILVVLGSIGSLVLLIVGGLQKKNHQVIGICAIFTLASMFFGSIGIGIMPKNYFGLVERFSVFSVVIFTGILGVWGFFKPDSE